MHFWRWINKTKHEANKLMKHQIKTIKKNKNNCRPLDFYNKYNFIWFIFLFKHKTKDIILFKRVFIQVYFILLLECFGLQRKEI